MATGKMGNRLLTLKNVPDARRCELPAVRQETVPERTKQVREERKHSSNEAVGHFSA